MHIIHIILCGVVGYWGLKTLVRSAFMILFSLDELQLFVRKVVRPLPRWFIPGFGLVAICYLLASTALIAICIIGLKVEDFKSLCWLALGVCGAFFLRDLTDILNVWMVFMTERRLEKDELQHLDLQGPSPSAR